MINFYRKYRKYFSVVFTILLMCSFLQLGIPLISTLAFGMIFLVLIILREPIGKFGNKVVNQKFTFLNKLPSWLKKVIVILIFYFLYMLLKQSIFWGLKLVGIDLKEIILKSTNQF